MTVPAAEANPPGSGAAARASGPSGPRGRAALHAPLSHEMAVAARAIAAMRAGRSLPAALDAAVAHAGPALPDASRAAAHHLAYTAARRLGAAEFLLARLAPRAPAAPVAALALVALSQMLEARRHDAVLVDEAVSAARADRDTAAAAGFLNAVLRRFGRERARWLAAIQQDETARHDHPRWWIDLVRQDHPEHWERILALAALPPPMTLRVNRRQGSRDTYLARLAAAGQPGEPLGEDGIVLAQPCDVRRLPGFADGAVSVQDFGAQLAAPWLDVQDGQRVLDACAAPGGKTAHLLERAELDLLGVDVDAQRLSRVADNLARLRLAGPRVRLLAADAARPEGWWDGRPFDRILLDAPCTASGIVRRHPDVRWLRRRGDVATLAAAQSALLEALWPLLAPGGKMLYVTCSVFSQENTGTVNRFVAAHGDCRIAAGPMQLLPSDAPGARHDGFHYALLEKTS